MTEEANGAQAGAWPIEHVFVLMLENRSFDHMFALSGIPGITAARSGDPRFRNSFGGSDFDFVAGAPEVMPVDPPHGFGDVVEQLTTDGAYLPGQPYPPIDNGGFVANFARTAGDGPPHSRQTLQTVMAGAHPNQLPALHALAEAFVLCDHWYASMPGPTWPNRFFVHGASAMGWASGPKFGQIATSAIDLTGFKYPNGSVFKALGKGRWRVYQDRRGSAAGRIPQVASLKDVSFFDVRDADKLGDDLKRDYPFAYTFIEPSYGNIANHSYSGGSSQHPRDGIAPGDRLVAEIYNAIRQSPLWEKSLLIVTYDEHGGFYDSEPAVKLPAPGDVTGPHPGKHQFDFTLSGVRVPAVLVSPWLPKGLVDHRVYDHSSVAATLTRLFGTRVLTERDRHANDATPLLRDVLRNDCPMQIAGPPPVAMPASHVARATGVDPTAPVADDGDFEGFMYVVRKAQQESATPSIAAAAAPKAMPGLTQGAAHAFLDSTMRDLLAEREVRQAAE